MKKLSYKHINLRLPVELCDQLDEFCSQQVPVISRTQLIIALIKAGFKRVLKRKGRVSREESLVVTFDD